VLVRTARRTAGPGVAPTRAGAGAILRASAVDQQRGSWSAAGPFLLPDPPGNPADTPEGAGIGARPLCDDVQFCRSVSGGNYQACAASSSRLRVRSGSTWMPGPIVVENTTFFRYLPLAAAGLARSTSSSAAP